MRATDARSHRDPSALAPLLALAVAVSSLAGGFPWTYARADDVPPVVAATKPAAPGVAPGTRAEIERLVADLGADEYFVREKAQRDLQRLGIVAFDAVYGAQQHPDIEVAHRAKYLVATIEIEWVEDRDAAEAKEILSRYEELPPNEREKAVIRLSELPLADALEPLCRVARFEPSESLSRAAALHLLDLASKEEIDDDARVATGRRVAGLSGSGMRPSSRWLAAFAAVLTDPKANVNRWEPLIQEDLDLYHRKPEQTDPNVIAELIRRHGEALLSLKRDDDAFASLKRLFQVIPDEPHAILLTVRWLVERKAWPVVLEAEARYAGRFASDVGLAYCAAEAHAETGDDEGAKKILDKLASDPTIEPARRLDVARELETWGRFDWAEGEYRLALDRLEPPNPGFAFASRWFSEMLHDVERDAEAAAVLKRYLDAIQANDQLRSIVENQFEWDTDEQRSRYAMFLGLGLQAEGKSAEARAAFEEGCEAYAFDPDLLIAMYRAPDAPEDFRERTRKRIDATRDFLKAEIASARQEAEIAQRTDNVEAAQRNLALQCNQYAWLVGNTFGDFDDAVNRSEESLKLRAGQIEEGGYLDTLARAQFSRGDVEQAIRTQRKALKHDPHSGAMNRQLREFERSLPKPERAE